MSAPELVLPATGADPRLEVGGSMAALDVEELAHRFGTPLFVYDGEALRARAALLREALPDEVDLAFAVKANPSPAVLAVLASSGAGRRRGLGR